MFEKKSLLLLLLIPLFVVTACSPKYPNCDKDEDCAASDKGKAEGKLMCINGLCQQCRLDADCAGEGMMCDRGVCARIENYCNSVKDCVQGYTCRNNRCVSGCDSDENCPNGLVCKAGKCADPLACTVSSDCENGLECIDGRCGTPRPVVKSCTLDEIHFEYNSSSLERDSQSLLQEAAACIKDGNLRVRIEGHADERGTAEYNLALGERRARNAYNYLIQLGIPSSSLSTISYGEEKPEVYCGENASDSCYRKNRRVVFRKL